MQKIRRTLSRIDGAIGGFSLNRVKNISLGLALEKQAKKRPSQTAILFEDRSISYREFNEAANRYAHLFKSRGFKKGDVVALLMENRPEYLIIIAGLAKLGVIISLINTGVRGKVLAHAANICDAQAIIVGNELLAAFEDVAAEIKLKDPALIFVENDAAPINTALNVEDLAPLLMTMPPNNPDTTAAINSEDVLYYIYTSGTTGFPKATASKHQNWFVLGYGTGGLGLELIPGDVLYNVLPLYHNSGANIAFASFLMHGSTFALRRKFSARNFWNDIRKYNASHFIYIGELCRYLNNQPSRPDDLDNPLQYILGNGMRGEYWTAFKKRFGIRKIVEVYGATEGVARIINLKQAVGMMGNLSLLGVRIGEVVQYDVESDRIKKDAAGRPIQCKVGDTGLLISEINFRASFPGYVNNSTATEAKILRNVFREGDQYFNTGDLVKLHRGRNISFVDRLGDTFRWKGENVATNEVADILNQFGQIEDSNVFGVEVKGTEGRCGMVALKLLEGEQLDWDAFAHYVIKNLPVYARPYFIRLRCEIDATNSFKQLKTMLQKEGFDPRIIKDPLFFLDPRKNTYVPLTAALYEEINRQKIAF